ncbi:hypothetical protein D3C72_1366740 [compost metagenome]
MQPGSYIPVVTLKGIIILKASNAHYAHRLIHDGNRRIGNDMLGGAKLCAQITPAGLIVIGRGYTI